jgi:hypothetical protein
MSLNLTSDRGACNKAAAHEGYLVELVLAGVRLAA